MHKIIDVPKFPKFTAGALKFVMEYESGKGNYTELRRKMFERKSVKDIIQDMKKEGIT